MTEMNTSTAPATPAEAPWFIVVTGYGSTSVFAGSLNVALQIFEHEKTPGHIKEAASLLKDSSVQYRNVSLLYKGLSDILTKSTKTGEDGGTRFAGYWSLLENGSSRQKATPITSEMQRELQLYLLDSGHDTRSITGDFLKDVTSGKLNPYEALSFMRDSHLAKVAREAGRILKFMDESYLDAGDSYNFICEKRWESSKAPTSERQVASSILRFVEEYVAHRDIKYEICELRTKYW